MANATLATCFCHVNFVIFCYLLLSFLLSFFLLSFDILIRTVFKFSWCFDISIGIIGEFGSSSFWFCKSFFFCCNLLRYRILYRIIFLFFFPNNFPKNPIFLFSLFLINHCLFNQTCNQSVNNNTEWKPKYNSPLI